MSVITHKPEASYQNWMDELLANLKSHENGAAHLAFSHFQQNARERLETMDFPTRRDEDWKYTPVKRILQPDYREGKKISIDKELVESFDIPGIAAIRLVFVNGLFSEELSDISEIPSNVILLKISEAMEDAALKTWLVDQVKLTGGTDKNTFLTLNQALAKDGLYIQVKADNNSDLPIHIQNIHESSTEAILSNPQLFIHAGRGSSSLFIESFHCLDGSISGFTNAMNHIDVEANAQLIHYRIQLENKESFQINNTIVRQARDSVYTSYAIDLGGQIIRNNLSSILTGTGTETNFYGIYAGNGYQHVDNQTYIDHAMPHCQSNELYKGILDDKARGVFNGKVMVRQDAQKTNAFQQNSSLVLSPTAIMDTKPQLEIFADDVRCSHGATIGQIDENWVFYLKSRGIPDMEARRILQLAFIGEVLDKMSSREIREYIEDLIELKFSN